MSKLAKRTKAEKEEHMNIIARMYVKGRTQMEMARELGLSQGQISNDLRNLLKSWEESRMHNIDLHKNAALLRINMIEEELWEAWEKSKTAKKVVNTKSKSGEMADALDASGRPIKTSEEKYWRAGSSEELPTGGDMQYMNGIMWCLQERAKIMSLYAPKKIANTDPTGTQEAGQSAKEILSDIIGGILKRADGDKNIVEGELLALDGDNDKAVDDDELPELAKRINDEKIRRLPPAPKVEYDQNGNLIING